MLVLHASRELEITFKKLIETIGAKVVWDGRFVVIDNQLILEGTVRSLFFQFDTRKVLTNLIDLDIKEDQIIEISEHPKLQDLIHIILYAFGKWGTLKGVRVDQDYAQLNQLFTKILQGYYIEPAFQKENFRFYKDNICITYEDVIETALLSEERPEEEPKEEWEEETHGLWHKLIWKNRQRIFKKVETTLAQRQQDRMGHNFYLTGYECPKCSKKIYMAVYPVGKEVRIETEEKGVFLARAYTCNDCCCFYTPRPDRLISEGLIYEMSFGDDKKAYEDYLELLGQDAERTSNFKFNEYEAVRNLRLQKEQNGQEEQKEAGHSQADLDALHNPEDALRQMESFSRRFESLPDDVFQRFTDRVEDSFYPDSAVAEHEKEIQEQVKKRRRNAAAKNAGQKNREKKSEQKRNEQRGNNINRDNVNRSNVNNDNINRDNVNKDHINKDNINRSNVNKDNINRSNVNNDNKINNELKPNDQKHSANGSEYGKYADIAVHNKKSGEYTDADFGTPAGMQDSTERKASPRLENYHARLGVLNRLSARQRAELKKQIQKDDSIDENTKRELLRPIEEAQVREKASEISKKVEGSQHRSYAQIHRVMEEVEQEALPAEMKRSFLEKLRGLLRRRGAEEVRQIMEKTPERLDRAGYQDLERKLKAYEEVDLSPYQETLRRKRGNAEKQEIANMVKRARKIGRGDYTALMARLEQQNFADENVRPYMEKIQERLRELDEEAIDQICGHVHQMDFDAAADAYEQIELGSFLPELKDNALEMLSKRLEKIRTDECELLVHKLQEEMGGKFADNLRHHFYPARKVMLKTAEPEETRVIDNALAAYASGRELFEYPIFAADTSRNQSGREGMLLTPDKLFYGTRLSAYEVPVSSVDSIKASTGLLNRRITLEEKNGAKHKLPYAVGTNEMKDWAGVLESFIQYLQEKPASRKLTYLAKEKHDRICCFRCGAVYQDSAVCPECGYKMNQ